ncbi:MAG: Gfo/Idh/MocA family oxidoreductase [Cyclobacteriaceae bacterium]|nr:Gfo/Idh/MocA family oxidoreductase [Cyclobacteriaceae bacterium]
MKKLKFAIFGTGFLVPVSTWCLDWNWKAFECVALYNRTLSKADKLAERFHISHTYDVSGKNYSARNSLTLVDIITDVDTHYKFVKMALDHGINHIICQKPHGARFLKPRNKWRRCCRDAGARFYIHENYRWERPLRRFKEILDSGVIGKPFKARLFFNSGFPVFDNQPILLLELDKFILTDMGSHILDVARFMFGECERLWCQTLTVNPKIKARMWHRS